MPPQPLTSLVNREGNRAYACANLQSGAEAKPPGLPDMKVSVRQVFGIDTDLEVPAYSKPDEHVPDVDPTISSTGR